MNQQPLYPHGIPNFNRLGFLNLGILGSGPMDFRRTVEVIASALNRPVHFVDDSGYEREVIAGAVGAQGERLAWVESKSKELETGFVEVEFRLKAQQDGQPTIDWVVETYNPYFGCRVGYMAWLEERVLVIYREKHHTYACTLRPDGSIRREQIADEWLVANDQIAYVSERLDTVKRLSLPEFNRLDDMDAEQARSAGLLPPRFNEVNAHRRGWAKREADPASQERLQAKKDALRRRAEGGAEAGIGDK